MLIRVKKSIKKCVEVGVFFLILFSINFTNVFAKEDKSKQEEAFKNIANGFVDIEVYSKSQDGANNTYAKGKGLFITKNNNSSYVLVDYNLGEKAESGSSSGGQGASVKAILSNGVEMSLTKELSSSSLGIAVFKTGKEIKNDLTIRYALGEEKVKEDSKIFTCDFNNANKINEVGTISEYQERSNASFFTIQEDNGYKAKRGDFIFDENGVCIGMMLDNQDSNDAVCMNSVSNVMKEFDVAFDGYVYTDKSKLQKAISDAKDLNTSKYKKDSVKAFDDAIDKAKECFDNEESTKEDIEKSINNLNEAENGLKLDLLMYIIIASVLLVLLIILIIIHIIKRKKKKKKLEEEKRQERLKRIEDDLKTKTSNENVNLDK